MFPMSKNSNLNELFVLRIPMNVKSQKPLGYGTRRQSLWPSLIQWAEKRHGFMATGMKKNAISKTKDRKINRGRKYERS